MVGRDGPHQEIVAEGAGHLGCDALARCRLVAALVPGRRAAGCCGIVTSSSSSRRFITSSGVSSAPWSLTATCYPRRWRRLVTLDATGPIGVRTPMDGRVLGTHADYKALTSQDPLRGAMTTGGRAIVPIRDHP